MITRYRVPDLAYKDTYNDYKINAVSDLVYKDTYNDDRINTVLDLPYTVGPAYKKLTYNESPL